MSSGLTERCYRREATGGFTIVFASEAASTTRWRCCRTRGHSTRQRMQLAGSEAACFCELWLELGATNELASRNIVFSLEQICT